MRQNTKGLKFVIRDKSNNYRWYSHSQGRISNHSYNARSTAIAQLGRYLKQIMEGKFEFEDMTEKEKARLYKIIFSA